MSTVVRHGPSLSRFAKPIPLTSFHRMFPSCPQEPPGQAAPERRRVAPADLVTRGVQVRQVPLQGKPRSLPTVTLDKCGPSPSLATLTLLSQDGKVKCDRKRCTRSACEGALSSAHAHQALRRSSALHAHAGREDSCCMAQCRRFRRHHNKSRNEPRNEPRRVS